MSPKRRPPISPKRPAYRMRVPQTIWLVPLALLIGFGTVFCYVVSREMETSNLQAEYLTQLTSDIRFELDDGANPDMRFPTFGPYNQRLGYSYLPFFIKALNGNDYTIAQQMRASPRYQQLVDKGFYPIYHAKTVAGLNVLDREGQPLYGSSYPTHIFGDFRSIPPLLVNTLLFIENRELLQPGTVTRNPVIEWDRFLFAAVGRVIQNFAPGFNTGGGSTLATQIEKFRYSPGGQTNGSMEKLRQVASASLRVYLDGPDTRAARERIVLDYLNSTPLSARPGFGEVNSIGDGLWAWFGHNLSDVTTALNLPETDRDSLRVKAIVYREIVGLILAQRRPTSYLLTDREALDELTAATLDRLAMAGIISRNLRDATKAARFKFLADIPPMATSSFLEQKASTALRNHLLSMLRLKNLYELDRIDLDATSTLDQNTQKQVIEFLKRMDDPAFLNAIGLYGFRLLNPSNDPSKIKWSVVLYERAQDGNRLRVQADNIDGPFDMNDGVKLDLGSTAKLRTLVTYLEIVCELHRRYAGLAAEDLRDLAAEAPDALTAWATTRLAAAPDATLDEMLEAAMNRQYSGNPNETFFTGGGAHHFVNFEHSEDKSAMDLHEAMRNSVNLVFIRLMRDIVNYTIAQGQMTRQELMEDPDHPARKAYLERYAEREGSVFLGRYISDYAQLSMDDALDKAASHAHKGATALTILFRSVRPKADFADYAAWMRRHVTTELGPERLRKLYTDYPSERYNLSDRGYIAGLNPLELWLISYRQSNPKASRSAILAVSKPILIESYAWLFHPHLKGAQDTRIRILLEADAFAHIQQRWERLGYPFGRLVPSFATAIGSSADRPGALAELVGILLNDGVKKPMLRFEKLRFAADTPYETTMIPGGNTQAQVLSPSVARVVRAAMTEVVANGTAKRLYGAYVDKDGQPLAVGGKTGTGDHRFDEFGKGGKLISSRVVNRTGTIAFFIGDRFFGTITAHVAGEGAADYKFTSALSAQMLRSMQPVLQPLINGTPQTVTVADLAKKGMLPKPPPADIHEVNEGNKEADEDTNNNDAPDAARQAQ